MASSSGCLCAVSGCGSSRRRDKHLSFFHLPTDPTRRKAWADLIDREDLANSNKAHELICSLHFDSSVVKYIPKLQPHALPTKLLPCDPTTSASTINIVNVKSEYDQTTDTDALSFNVTEREHTEERTESSQYVLEKIKPELKEKDEEQSQEKFYLETKDGTTQRFYKLIKWQDALQKKTRGNRCDPVLKLFALNLHFSSPHVYQSLKTFLTLPSESTLRKFKIIVPPKFDDRTLEFLTAKLKSLPENAKYCTLCIDEIVLKRHLHYDTKRDEIIGLHNINGKVLPEIASHACVVMLRGIIVNWKQPIAYSFLGSLKYYESFGHWIDEILMELTNIGIKVKAIVSVQGSIFEVYAKQIKKVSKQRTFPYFLFNENKIYCIFDVPNLLKCLRNNLILNAFIREDDQMISWDYIKVLYEKQQEENLRLIPKITYAHIKPNSYQKMRVRYAAQIFSNSVCAGLNILILAKYLPEQAKATADFVEKINNLFDVLNSSSVKCPNNLKKPLSMKENQLEVLEEGSAIFNKLKAIGVNTGVDNTIRNKTFANFQVTIKAIIMLCEDLKREGFDNILTRRLNRDCLENFFNTVRRRKGNYRDPTAIQFQRAFSKLYLSSFLKTSSNSNCHDVCELMQNDPGFLKTPTPRLSGRRYIPSVVALNGETDYRFDVPTENALAYISAYLLYKCNNKHTCPEFDSRLNYSSDGTKMRMISFLAYNINLSFYGKLKLPSDTFCNYIKELETAFVKYFAKNLAPRPGSTIFEILKSIPFDAPCSCFPQDYLLKVFLRLRIYSTITSNNHELRLGKKYTVHQYLKIKHYLF